LFLRHRSVNELDREKPMTEEKPDNASVRRPGPQPAQPAPHEQKTSRETDRSRTGEGSGASGGGSLGNLPGAPVTGGSPEFGPKEIRPQKPPTDQPARDRKNDEP
jgi:hypothetical protein